MKAKRSYKYQEQAKQVQADLKDAYFPVPQENFYHEKYGNKIALSDSNSKVNKGIAAYIQAVINGWQADHFFEFISNPQVVAVFAFGKPAITSCPFAGSCMNYCYAKSVENCRYYSALIHAHNYYLIYGRSVDEIKKVIQPSIDEILSSPKFEKLVIRMGDSGDIMSRNEMFAWYEIAVDNPNVLIYGYTKSTPYYYQLLQANDGKLVDNFRLNISSTDNPISTQYRKMIERDYPTSYRYCRILETVEDWNPSQPFNQVEYQAVKPSAEKHIFQIGMHGTFKKSDPLFAVDKFYKSIENYLQVEVC